MLYLSAGLPWAKLRARGRAQLEYHKERALLMQGQRDIALNTNRRLRELVASLKDGERRISREAGLFTQELQHLMTSLVPLIQTLPPDGYRRVVQGTEAIARVTVPGEQHVHHRHSNTRSRTA